MSYVAESEAINPQARITCGTWLWEIAKKPYRRRHYCMTWKCQDGICQGRLIERLQGEIKAAAAATVAFTDTTRKRSKEDIKSMSNFLTRKVNGKFWKILSDDRCLLISTVDFPGSVRRSTKIIITANVPAILAEPWTPPTDKRIRRVTRRRGQREPKLKNTDKAFGMFAAGEGREELMKEFDKLTTDNQRAEWLVRHSEEKITLYNRGKQIIANYFPLRGA